MKRVVMHIAPYNDIVRMLSNFSYYKYYFKGVCFLVGMAALYGALLRPQWGMKDNEKMQEGRDLFIALDVSKSMRTNDCNGSRLECAKQKIKTLVHMLQSERVGLILFSGSAFLQCPLTTDYGAFFLFLDSVDVESIASGGTLIEKAIMLVLDVYRSMPSKKNKLLVLFTDGEDFSSNLEVIKKQSQKEGLHIFACGIGTTQGGPIPIIDPKTNTVTHQKDKYGNVVISKLHESALDNLTSSVGGKYIQMTQGTTDMEQIVKRVGSFEKEEFGMYKQKVEIDRYPWFIAGAICCFLIEWML